MEQMQPRKFVSLSEYAKTQEADAIRIGSWKDCLMECVSDDSPCYIVEVLKDEDGDEVQDCNILFVNKAWTRRFVR